MEQLIARLNNLRTHIFNSIHLWVLWHFNLLQPSVRVSLLWFHSWISICNNIIENQITLMVKTQLHHKLVFLLISYSCEAPTIKKFSFVYILLHPLFCCHHFILFFYQQKLHCSQCIVWHQQLPTFCTFIICAPSKWHIFNTIEAQPTSQSIVY